MKVSRVLAIVGAVITAAILLLWTPDLSRTELEAKYLAAPGDLREVAGMRLHVRDTGPPGAPVLIMIHGFASSLQTWDAWSVALSDKYRVVRFDLPGSGLSDPDPTGDYTDARSTQLVRALMDALHIDRATIVGNSIGGRIAWKFAAGYPERVTALVLIAPDGYASPGFAYDVAPDVGMSVQVLRYTMPKWLVRRSLESIYADPAHLTEPVLDRYYDLLRGPGTRKAQIDRLRQTVLQPPDPILRRIRVPVLLLWGEKDNLIPFSNAADYVRALPDVKLVAFPDLGHVPQEENPQASLAPLQTFLEQIRTRTSVS